MFSINSCPSSINIIIYLTCSMIQGLLWKIPVIYLLKKFLAVMTPEDI